MTNQRKLSLSGLLSRRGVRAGQRRRRANRNARLGCERLERRELLAGDALADIAWMSDEFDSAASISEWQRIHQTEGWNADQLNLLDIDTTQPGRMVMQPHTVVWYADWRGPLVYKEITGDFVVTTSVQITDRDEIGGSDDDDVPGDSQFSLGGLMIRTPRDITNGAADWLPGSGVEDGTNNGENYVFLSMGYTTGDNNFSFEVKTTRNSNSVLELTPLTQQPNEVELQLARIGDSVIALHRLSGETEWTVHRRYSRPDMPETLQVGMVTYSDWEKANDWEPSVHNGSVLAPGQIADVSPFQPFNPDLTASFDYTRFARPSVPDTLAGVDLSDPTTVSSAVLLTFLGDNVVVEPIVDPEPEPQPTTETTRIGVNLGGLVDWDPAWMFKDAFHRARPWGARAQNVDTGETVWQFNLGEGPALAVDEFGWVTELPVWQAADGTWYQQQASTVVFIDHANQPAGIYTVEWDGEGDLAMPYVIESGMTLTGRNYALVNMPFNAPFGLEILSTNPLDPVRNIDVWMPEYNGESFVGDHWQPGDGGSPFHPLFLERVDDFDTLRFMDLMSTNHTNVITWDDRRTLAHATQSDGDQPEYFHSSGVALEYLIELSNAVDANPWFNLPHEADDDFVFQFATLVRDTLDPELTVYVEWSNELWNAQFPVNQWLQQQMTLPENSGLDFFQVAGQEIQRDFDIWSDVFAGQEQRLVRVVAGQQANAWLTEQLLLNVDGRVDAVSVTAYAGISYDMADGYDANTTADDIIDDLLNISIPWAAARLQEHNTLVEQYEQLLGRDLQFVTYESGSHVFGAPNPFLSSPALAAALEATDSPRMYDVYQTLLGEVRDAGVDLYNEFNFTSHDGASFFGTYGLLHDMTTPVEDAHQLRALLDFAASQASADGPLVAITLEVVDAEGNPLNSLVVGQEFTLRGVVDDLRQDGTGVFSVYLDVTYSDDVAATNGPVAFGDDYTNAREGNTLVAGLIDEVGAVATLEQLGGEPVVLFTLPMIATATGVLTFAGDPADLLPDHEVTLFDFNHPVPHDRILFNGIALNVVPVATAAPDDFTIFNDGQTIEFDVLLNDADDPEASESLTIVAVSSASGGQVAIHPDGDRLLFTPAADFYGETVFEYTLQDENGQQAQASVTVQLHKRWQNPVWSTDVNGDTNTSPIDALLVINVLNSLGTQALPLVPPPALANWPYLDVSGDNVVSPLDVLQVINVLNDRAAQRGFGEGEAVALTAWIPAADQLRGTVLDDPLQDNGPIEMVEPVADSSIAPGATPAPLTAQQVDGVLADDEGDTMLADDHLLDWLDDLAEEVARRGVLYAN